MAETKKKPEIAKKTEAACHGYSEHLSTKYAVEICRFISGKQIDDAIKLMENASKMKIPVPMRGEYAHQHGIMSGKYPVKGAKIFLSLLKSLKANAIHVELPLEKARLECYANLAQKPYKRFGQGRSKRTHITLKLKAIEKKENGKQ